MATLAAEQPYTHTWGLGAAPSLESSDVLETRSVQLEWKVTNLKQLFESTKGEVKSKCVKSPLFDNSRWQIFLYPNSGHDQYLSLYLSCEPTPADRERGIAEAALHDPTALAPAAAGKPLRDGKDKDKEKEKDKDKDKGPWRREGEYKFTFEARDVTRRLTFKQMEADQHTFSSKERNWGYQSFWRRNEAYYNNSATRNADAFLIVCTIVSCPTLPAGPNPPHVSIPRDLVSSFASLFDDPEYSDIVFRIRPEDGEGKRKGKEKRLYAAKKILAGRSEYFRDMFNSGFTESTAKIASSPGRPKSQFAELNDDSDLEFDSDDEGEAVGFDEDDDSAVDESEVGDEDKDVATERVHDEGHSSPENLQGLGRQKRHSFPVAFPTSTDASTPLQQERRADASTPTRSRTSSTAISNDGDEESMRDTTLAEDPSKEKGEAVGPRRPTTPPLPLGGAAPQSPSWSKAGEARFVDARSAPSSPVRQAAASSSASKISPRSKVGGKRPRLGGRSSERARSEVVVTDASYSTFRALLYYLYSNQISFSPLASTYYAAKDRALQADVPFNFLSREQFILAHSPPTTLIPSQFVSGTGGPGAGGTGESQKVGPASAKAIYRLADKMGLDELKALAFRHVVSSLTSRNVVYEAFGSFSMRFDEVKRVEVAFLLEHWNEVRTSPSMRKVFEYLRSGNRFPGFEDVWLSIMENLEYKPPLVASGFGAAAMGTGGAGGGSDGFGGAAGDGERRGGAGDDSNGVRG
ncbi:hypothetical protein JCM10212_006793 [Sporobolomyces blumeae]